MLNFRRLGRGTKPNIAIRAQPNLPKNGLFVHVREGRLPVYAALNFLDPCLRRDDGPNYNRLPNSSHI
jgi:hypothetical protein